MSKLPDPPVEEIIARCLTEPSFLSAVLSTREAALAGYALDPCAKDEFARTDFERIRQFSGFITKVQHNFLWDWFPATLKLLRHYDVDLDFFAEYRHAYLASGPRGRSQRDKVDSFLQHLTSYLAERQEFPGLSNVIRYERTIWELHQNLALATAGAFRAAGEVKALPWRDILRLVPVLNEPLRIELFDCNPAALVASVMAGAFRAPTAEPARVFAIRIDPSDMTLRTLEIEELPALLLSCINGRRSLRSVIARARGLALNSARPAAFSLFFRDAAEFGLVRFRSESRSCA